MQKRYNNTKSTYVPVKAPADLKKGDSAMKVLKFGGTSMADAAQYRKVRAIVRADEARRVVVVSAAGKRFAGDTKVTDLLYLCYAHMQYGVGFEDIWQSVVERYCAIRDELGLRADLESAFAALRARMKEGISRDELVSRGEYFSALLMAEYLGFPLIDAKDWLKFHYDGTIDQSRSYACLRELVAGGCAVIPGFYGETPEGEVRVLTRGGSDITGALAAAALGAELYENWTDVSGMLMADPRIVADPKPIARATYEELRQLSYTGAQVLHEMTVFPVREMNIPLNIRNTNDPDHPGTLVSDDFREPPTAERFITGIAGRRDFSVLTVARRGLSGAVGALRSVFAIFERLSVPVSYVTTGVDSVSLAVQTEQLTPYLYTLTDELRKAVHPDSLTVTDNLAIVAVVGRRMAFRAGTSGKIFAALGKRSINIRMIAQGPEETTILVGVENKDYEQTVRELYDAFVK